MTLGTGEGFRETGGIQKDSAGCSAVSGRAQREGNSNSAFFLSFDNVR